jgi:hypothetical protein
VFGSYLSSFYSTLYRFWLGLAWLGFLSAVGDGGEKILSDIADSA